MHEDGTAMRIASDARTGWTAGRVGARMAAGAAAALTLLAVPAAAQVEPPRPAGPGMPPCTYDACALRVEEGWFSRTLVRGPDGTVVARLGIGGPSLASVVAASDSAVVHARRYQSAQATGSVLTTVGSLGTLAAVLVLNQREGDVRQEAIAVNVAGLAVWIAGRTFHQRAQREMQRSLWWYNRTVTGGR